MSQNILTSSGIVAIPLLIFSILSLALIAERCYFWIRVWRKQDALVSKLFKLLSSDWYSAIQLLKKNIDLPIARVFLEALELEDPTVEEFQIALETAARAELPNLRRFNTVFDTIVAVSPLLGLLGTVLGLITSFASLKLGDVSSSDTIGVTGGISEALGSTVLGLVVAIFTLLFANTFRSFYRRQVSLISEYGGRLELLFRKARQKTNGKVKEPVI
ncbi:MAG: MotA/TolQ/ExbB proton channel family protein [Cyanobacteria bacterium SID2]|nr:MotA/TolQ/ExbB proton channel family protein [Cyanobacteria bacterium SID2]MBP0002771.1 MotA/TolQ/ExbB proton channel family protein [Cyanobacteria bacterium SBC]